MSVIEAAERDITALNNDFNFRKLSHEVEKKYPEDKMDFLDLFSMDPESEGPWAAVANKVKAEIKNIEHSKQKIQQMTDKHKEQIKQIMIIKKENAETLLINKSLET